MLNSSYYEQEWKNLKGVNYYNDFKWTPVFQRQEAKFREYLKRLSARSVLEFGSGFGRMSKIVLEELDPLVYIGVDVSPHQIANAAKFLNADWVNVAFIQGNILTYQDDRHYDLVLASELLLHILPDDIERAVAQMVRYSKRDIIHIDWARDYEKSSWCFIHDYYDLFTKAGAMLINEVKIDQQSIWHWRVKE